MGMRKSLTIFIILELVMYMPLSPIGGLHFEIMFGSRSWGIQPRHFCMGCTFLLACDSAYWNHKQINRFLQKSIIRFLQNPMDIHTINEHIIPRSECREKESPRQVLTKHRRIRSTGKRATGAQARSKTAEQNNIKGQSWMCFEMMVVKL